MEKIEMNASEKGSWNPKDITSEQRGMIRNLVLAAKNGDEEKVVEILKTDEIYIDSKYKWETALMGATRRNNVNLCKILLNHGADCNISRILQQTPLWIAACNGNIHIMELMLETKTCTQVNLDNTLLRCVEMNFLYGCEILLQAGADVQASDSMGLSALHLAAGGKYTMGDDNDMWKVHNPASWQLYFSNEHDIAELLIMWNADVNAVDFDKCTPLHLACESKDHDMIELLIENHANINAVGGDPLKTPLHVLINNDSSNLVEMLLKNPKIKPNIPDSENDTPLMSAIKLHKKECVRIFLMHEKWADFMSVFCRGESGTDEYIDTPMRQLISHMPDLACFVMDKCIELSHHRDPKHPEFMARFNFFLFDDTYTSTNWEEATTLRNLAYSTKTTTGHENIALSASPGSTLPRMNIGSGMDTVHAPDDPSMNQRLKSRSLRGSRSHISTAPTCDSDVFNCSRASKFCVLHKTSRPYTNSRRIIKKNHPIYIAYHKKNCKVMMHPLAIALVNHKWQRVGRYRFYGGILMYMAFVVLLSTHVMMADSLGQVLDGNNSSNHTENVTQKYQNMVLDVISNIILFLCCICLLSKILALIPDFPRSCFMLGHWMDTAVYCMALANVLNEGVLHHTLLPQDYPLAAICIFTAWFNVLLEIRQFPIVGIYFIMFTRILEKSVIVIIIFFPIIVGFSLTFAILLDFKPLFDKEFAVATVLVMLSGEVDYMDTLTSGNKLNRQIKHQEITITIYVFFILLMVICLLNLLVGLAVSDVETLHKKSESEMMSLKAEQSLTSEMYFSLVPNQRIACGCIRYEPNKKRDTAAYGRKRKFLRKTLSTWFNLFDFTDSRLGAEKLIKIRRQEKGDQGINLLRKEIASLKVQLGSSNTQTPRVSVIKKRRSTKLNVPQT